MKTLLKELHTKFEQTEKKRKPKRWQDNDGDGIWYEPGDDVAVNEQEDEPEVTVTDLDKAKKLVDQGMNVKLVDEGLQGALDEPYYIEVSLRDARKALNLFADKKNGYPEVTIYGSNVYASFVQSEIENLMADFDGYDIEVLDSTIDWQGDFMNPEPDEDIDEASTSSGAGAYNIPAAFSTPEQARKKKKMKYAGVAESMDKKYEALIESYKEFALGNSKESPEQKVKRTIKEMAKQLREIETVVGYTHRMKTESGIAGSTYGSSVQRALTEISSRLIKISEKVRSLGE